jgi:hypothetical protein
MHLLTFGKISCSFRFPEVYIMLWIFFCRTRNGFLGGTEWYFYTFYFIPLNVATLSILFNHGSCILYTCFRYFSSFTWYLEGNNRRTQRMLSVWTPGSVNYLVILIVSVLFVKRCMKIMLLEVMLNLPCLYICICTFFFFLRDSPHWALASSFTRFLDHTQRHTTVGRTPLGERSARSRDLYLTTHNRRTSMPSVGFEPTIWACELSQTYALDRAATETG